MKKYFVLLFVILLNNAVFAQLKSGSIEYEISFPDVDVPKEQLAMMPSAATVYFSGEQSRSEMKMGLGMSIVSISNKEGVIMLMDIMGKKMAIRKPKDELQKDVKKANKELKVTSTDETKMIAGYLCKKAIIYGSDIPNMVVWYTDAITSNNDWNGALSALKGTALEFDMKTEQITMHMQAQKVSDKNPESKLFDVPADYKEVTEEQLKAMFGGHE